MLDIEAGITGISYKFYLCKNLAQYNVEDIREGMPRDTTFYLKVGNEKIAVSYWVSPKRTRSYPYQRVYDSLNFSGKKVTVIPVMKDEGFAGDRDYLQWDTISLMSLLGVYVVIGYYKDAAISRRFENKITDQVFDMQDILSQFEALLYYQSDALHWNLLQVDRLSEIGNKAISSYERIFAQFGQQTHDMEGARERINKVMSDKKVFILFSRELAREAQNREVLTTQPNELVASGDKARISIKNYLGGEYYFTADEARIAGDNIFLVEAKNTKRNGLPSLTDIKDGLFKMVLFSNLSSVKVEGKEYSRKAVLKLTGNVNKLTPKENEVLDKVKLEAMSNGFMVTLNNKVIVT